MTKDTNGNEIINWNGCRITIMKVTYAPCGEPIILINPKDNIENNLLTPKDDRVLNEENSRLNHKKNNLEYELRELKDKTLFGIIKWWFKNRKK